MQSYPNRCSWPFCSILLVLRYKFVLGTIRQRRADVTHVWLYNMSRFSIELIITKIMGFSSALAWLRSRFLNETQMKPFLPSLYSCPSSWTLLRPTCSPALFAISCSAHLSSDQMHHFGCWALMWVFYRRILWGDHPELALCLCDNITTLHCVNML